MSFSTKPITAPAVAAGLLAASLCGAPAQAHHSAAMYDMKHVSTISGVVKSVDWVNPHISFDVLADPKEGAQPVQWTMAASSPGVMMRSGWTKRSLQPGDRITVDFAPLRDGSPGGAMRKVVMANGKVLNWSFDTTPADGR